MTILDPHGSVAVPAKQHVDPPIAGLVRLSHVLRFGAPFLACYTLTGPWLPGFPAVTLSILVGAAFVFGRIRHVPLDRWAFNRIRFRIRPRSYSSQSSTRPARPSKDLLRSTAVDRGCIQTPARWGSPRHAILVSVIPPNYEMMGDDEKRTALANLAEILTGTEYAIQLLTSIQPFDPTHYFRGFRAPLQEQPNQDLRKRTIHYLSWLESFTKSHQVLDREFYVIVAATPENSSRQASGSVDKLRLAAASIARNLLNVGAEARVLDTPDVLDVLQDLYNPRSFATPAKLPGTLAPGQTRSSSRGRLSIPDCEIRSDHIVLGLDYVRTLVVRQYPESLPVAWLDGILALRRRIHASIHIEPKDAWLVRRRLQTSIIDLKTRINKRGRAGYDTTEEQQQLADLEQQRELVTARRTRYFETTTYLGVHATSADELEKACEEVQGLLRSLGVVAFAEPYTQQQAFEATLPLGIDALHTYSQTMDTPCATALYPFLTSSTRHLTGNLVGFHAQTGAPFLVDAWRFANHNRIYSGTSGSGKSYSVKLDILRTLMHRPRAWIYCIDPLREFGPSTLAMGGQVVYVGNATTTINPFDLNPILGRPRGAQGPAENAFYRKLAFLTIFFRVLLPGLDPYEASVLQLSLQQMYAAAGITPDATTHGRPAPTFQQFLTRLQNDARHLEDPRRARACENLATYLSPLLAGPLRSLDGPTNVQLHRNVVTFDLHSLDKHWFKTFMFVVLDFIETRFYHDETAPKQLVVDEAHNLMDDEETAQILNHMSRHLRHFRAGLTLVTQTPKTFLKNEHGEAVLANCLQVYLFRQSRVPEEVRTAFGLDDSDADLLTRLNTGSTVRHSECLFLTGSGKSYLALFASPHEDELFGTPPAAEAPAESQKGPIHAAGNHG